MAKPSPTDPTSPTGTKPAGLVQTAVETFGGLDVLVNNAGIVRDRMMANTSEEEFDAVIAVHLKGHFATMRHAASYWRGLSKEGKTVDARIINTSSGAGLQGSVGQGNYSAAKAGIAAMTLVAAAEMGRYGVTVNAIAPSARTRMTETVFAEMMATQDQDFDAMAPENVSPLVVWLGSVESRDVTGKVFEVEGGKVRVAEGWAHGPQIDKGARWDPAELGPSSPTCWPRRGRRFRSTGLALDSHHVSTGLFCSGGTADRSQYGSAAEYLASSGASCS